ncbi:MAG TPA: NirA family protein [Opitutales bacterium]|nr:NirA family protein [Opitutales bacterium]
MNPPVPTAGFTDEQKQYLEGFFAGLGQSLFVGHTAGGQITATPGEAPVNFAEAPVEDTVFGTPLSELSKPERWKYEHNPLDIWDKLVAHAEADKFPDETDTFRFKYYGLFYVAPAQDSFMLRVRIPAGELSSAQLHGLADLAAEYGGGYVHITTRANIQIREMRPRDIIKVLVRLQELGLTSRGAGADNVRNITSSPTSGFDPRELLDVRPYVKALHHYILNHRDLYGLPRKFNVAFDNGGAISAAADTNDIGFFARQVAEPSLAALPNAPAGIAPGVYFRADLGGITGHGDFARDTGLLIKPAECVAVAAAMIRVFNENGDRTNRKKARLKYLLEKMGVEKFLEETQKKLAFPLVRLPATGCAPRPAEIKHGWLGVYKQTQPGRNYLGVGVPVGKLSAKQLHRLADLAANFGQSEVRLTVWQNFLLPHVPDAFVETVKRSLYKLGFHTDAACATGGIIACTGNQGCKYSACDTKGHAIALAKSLGRPGVALDCPVNIHFTGCPNSCAQHYIGDIGLVGTKTSDGAEGYHVLLGGGVGSEQGLAREIFRSVRAEEINPLVEKILGVYVARRERGETFVQWARRHSVDELQRHLSE